MLMLFVAIAAVHLMASMVPGPDFLFVTRTSASQGKAEAFMSVLGITCGVAVWALVALMGLSVILHKMVWVRETIQVCGGAYLCWMGLMMLKSRRRSPDETSESASPSQRKSMIFFQGLLTNLSNPKVIIYFGSVFSIFIDDAIPSLMKWAIFVLMVSISFLWFCLVAVVFSRKSVKKTYHRISVWIDRVAGVFFACFGLHLIFSNWS